MRAQRVPELVAAIVAAWMVVPIAVALGATPATSVVAANVIGPSATFSEVSTSADCGNRLVAGGGTRLAQSTPTVEHNGIRLYATAPTQDGSSPSPGGSSGPTRWLSSGGSGGGVPSDAQTLGYALCLDAGPSATEVVVADTAGPGGAYALAQATATCPAGTRLLSGGAQTTPGTVGSLKPSGSFPSDSAGHPLVTGTDAQAWTAVGLNGGGGDQGNATHAFAVCATGAELPHVTIVHAQVPGPAAATMAEQVSVTCPDGTSLLGGGGYISDAFGLPGSQGDHLTGSYPSNATGIPVASGSAGSWTAASHTGGAESGGLTQTDVWAMCASATDAPIPLPSTGPAAGPGTPANTKPPSLSGARRVGRTLTASPGAWTNAPSGYAYAWLRCTRGDTSCTSITAARSRAYRLKLADAGARIRVRVTARNAGGSGGPAVSPASAPIQAGPVTAAQLKLDLRRQLAPAGRVRLVAPLLARGAATLDFRALRAGRVTISWYRAGTPHGRPILVARGTRAFSGAVTSTIDVKLTAAGRRLLARRAPHVPLRAGGTLVRAGSATLRATTTFVLTG